MSEQDDFQWSAFEVALIVSRQCGKGSILEARQLAGLALLGENLQVHTSHEFKTCFEHFLRMVNLAEACPEVDKQIVRIRRGAGEQAIEMRSGARLRFIARSGGSGRGMSGDAVYLDEAFALTPPMMGALLPTLSARPNPQIWYTSSAPLATSAVLHGVRERAIKGESPRLFFAEWSVPEGTDPRNVDAWYEAVPALGIRISEEFIHAELDALSNTQGEFLRERLGIPDPMPSAEGPPAKLNTEKWSATRGKAETITPGECVFAYDIHNGWGAVCAAAGSLASSYVDPTEYRSGDGWIPARLVELAKKWKPKAIGLHGGNGQAVAVLGLCREAFEAEGLDPDLLQPLTSAAYKAACGDLHSAVNNGTLRRPILEPDQLHDAGLVAPEKIIGDAWVWDRKTAPRPIPMLAAATVARALLPTVTTVVHDESTFINLDDFLDDD